MSKKSLIDLQEQLYTYINESLKPKLIEKRESGEVFTPIWFVNKMLDDVEVYYLNTYKKNIWEQNKLTWYDPAVGMGNYMITIYYRLMEGLKSKIKDDTKRKKHIIENMLYMAEKSKKNCFIFKQIFDINNEYKINLYEGDSLTVIPKTIFGLDKFNIIIGNPPYNKKLTKVGALPYYNEFIEYYMDKCDILTYVVPSRWFSGGKGLDKFRKYMLGRTDIVYIKHHNDASEIFGNTVNIEGGVNYFLKDNSYKGQCNFDGNKLDLNKYDIFVDSKYYDIIDKMVKYESITSIYKGRYFGIESNDKRLTDNENFIKCYVSQKKGFIKYIDKKYIKRNYNAYKIITARANGGNGCFGNIFIGEPNEIHTGSYISFQINNKNEAESLLSYMKCKLPNFMLSLRKNSQDISESTCKWVPLPPLDRTWTDSDIYKYFKLSKDDIQLINSTKIIGYKDLPQIEEKETKKKAIITVKGKK